MFHKGVIISKSDCCSSVGFPDLQDTQVTLWSGSEYRFLWPPPHGSSGMLSRQVLDPDTQWALEFLLQEGRHGVGETCMCVCLPTVRAHWDQCVSQHVWSQECVTVSGGHSGYYSPSPPLSFPELFLRAGLWTTEDNHLYWILFPFCFWAQTLFTHFIYQASVQVAFWLFPNV